MKFRFTDLEKDDLVNDTALRNIKLCAIWEGMSHPDLKYSEKLKILSKKFHLSPESIRNIIDRYSHESVETD